MRRYVTDAGPLLPRLHKLVRADCTTRNKRRAARLQANYDDLERRIEEFAAKEDLARVRPDLDGNEIMQILGIPAGPEVGEAWRYLKELRLDRGPLSHDEAVDELTKWWNAGGPRRLICHGVLPWRRGWLGDYVDRRPHTDVDGDGSLDAVGLDFDGDGLLDDAMADLDGDGLADHAVLDNDGRSGGVLHRRRDGNVGGQRRPDRAIAVVRPGRGGAHRRTGGRPRRRRAERRPVDRY